MTKIPVPGDVGTVEPASRRPVCMIVHAYYEEDARVRREAETLVAAGRPVDVIALRRPRQAATDTIEGVRVHRLSVRRHQGAGIGTYVGEYAAFFIRAAAALARAHPARRYALVQVHTTPDLLALAALPARLAGVPLLVDFHEAMPEFFAVRFPRAGGRFARAMLELQERLAIAIADSAIVANAALGDRLVDRGVDPGRVTVVPNTPDLSRFDPARHPARGFMADGVLRLVYCGALTPIYEVDVAIRAVDELRRLRPGLAVQFEIFGRGDAGPDLEALVAALGLSDVVHFHGRIPHEEVPAAIAAADIGIAPTRLDRYTRLSLSAKVYEYAAMGKLVLASRLPLLERVFGEAVTTYEPGEPSAAAAALLRLVDDETERQRSAELLSSIIATTSWDRDGAVYRELVETLIGRRRAGDPGTRRRSGPGRGRLPSRP